MYKIGKIEFYENKHGGTVEILKDNEIIKNIEFIIWNSGKIDLDDDFGFGYGKLYKDVIKNIELKSKSKY